MTSDIHSNTLLHILVGLGNFGRQYRNNRHNVGFMVVDGLADKLGVAFSRLESKALVAKTSYKDHRLLLAKPQTYMNRSGQAVGALLRFYKIPPQQILVIYDDVDLPLGTLRIRPGGGSAGQKGMQSIIESLGTQDFPRLRVGIDRPPGRMEAADYVLQDFTKDQLDSLPFILSRAVEAALVSISEGLETAMNLYNPTNSD